MRIERFSTISRAEGIREAAMGWPQAIASNKGIPKHFAHEGYNEGCSMVVEDIQIPDLHPQNDRSPSSLQARPL